MPADSIIMWITVHLHHIHLTAVTCKIDLHVIRIYYHAKMKFLFYLFQIVQSRHVITTRHARSLSHEYSSNEKNRLSIPRPHKEIYGKFGISDSRSKFSWNSAVFDYSLGTLQSYMSTFQF